MTCCCPSFYMMYSDCRFSVMCDCHCLNVTFVYCRHNAEFINGGNSDDQNIYNQQ